MSYLVLARKYRPQTFQELVGQEHVTTTLTNALEAQRLAHAYIFSGPRGCGKTTTARLLAKALNCLKGPTANPCGECPQCREIASGSSPDDVLEIDGASNRGIDQIRELRDTVKYSPARSRYRIYIIDEAHQITEAGFNALLKTLEEPPPHAVFMMATTEAQKIPATILSRCQRFQLKPIPPTETQQQLKKIIRQEKLSVDDDALLEVARAAHGSLRDALSLLDQVIAYSPQGVTGQAIRSLLGLLPREAVKNFADVLRQNAPEKVLQAVGKAVEDGFDLFQLAHDLLDHWHQILLWKGGVQNSHVPNAAELESDAGGYSLEELERNLHVASRCVEQMRRSESPRVTFELSALELAKKTVPVDELISRLEELEKSLEAGVLPPLKKKPCLTPEETPSPQKEPSLPAEKETNGPEAKQGPPEDAGLTLSPDRIGAAWASMLEEIGKRKPSLEPFLSDVQWEIQSNGSLNIQCAQDFQKQQIMTHLALVKDVLEKHLARPVSLVCLLVPLAPSARTPAPEKLKIASSSTMESQEPIPDEVVDETSDPPEAVMEPLESGEMPSADGSIPVEAHDTLTESNPGVKRLLELFPGKIKKIDPAP
ncbi:MAG: DNA polymerase III subunit gamma/tau [Elusimicrobia bacterium]|nr:DNA polymerase III subunit gamma/tau [Elusimicrobiota bacterium]